MRCVNRQFICPSDQLLIVVALVFLGVPFSFVFFSRVARPIGRAPGSYIILVSIPMSVVCMLISCWWIGVAEHDQI